MILSGSVTYNEFQDCKFGHHVSLKIFRCCPIYIEFKTHVIDSFRSEEDDGKQHENMMPTERLARIYAHY